MEFKFAPERRRNNLRARQSVFSHFKVVLRQMRFSRQGTLHLFELLLVFALVQQALSAQGQISSSWLLKAQCLSVRAPTILRFSLIVPKCCEQDSSGMLRSHGDCENSP